MIFLSDFDKISETKWRIGFQHNMPFDQEHGLKNANGQLRSVSDLETIGIFVDIIPEAISANGMIASGMFVNPKTKEISYEYAEPQLTQDQQIAELQAQNAQMLLALTQGGLI